MDLLIGDSKTVQLGDYGLNLGVGKTTVGWWRYHIRAKVADLAMPDRILINLGVNDLPYNPIEEVWFADYQRIVTILRKFFYNCPIFITKPWRRGWDKAANKMSRWIDELADVQSGADERAWLRGRDNGLTYTSDGVHYNEEGIEEAKRQYNVCG